VPRSSEAFRIRYNDTPSGSPSRTGGKAGAPVQGPSSGKCEGAPIQLIDEPIKNVRIEIGLRVLSVDRWQNCNIWNSPLAPKPATRIKSSQYRPPTWQFDLPVGAARSARLAASEPRPTCYWGSWSPTYGASPRALSILIDEYDTGFFKRPSDRGLILQDRNVSFGGCS